MIKGYWIKARFAPNIDYYPKLIKVIYSPTYFALRPWLWWSDAVTQHETIRTKVIDLINEMGKGNESADRYIRHELIHVDRQRGSWILYWDFKYTVSWLWFKLTGRKGFYNIEEELAEAVMQEGTKYPSYEIVSTIYT